MPLLQKHKFLNPSTGIKVTWASRTPVLWKAEMGRSCGSLAASLVLGSVRDPASRAESDRAPSSGLHMNTQAHTYFYHAQLIESRWWLEAPGQDL